MKYVQIRPLERPVTKTISVPGSKSYTNRALILSVMTHNPVRIKNPLYSDDTQAMIACLETLGINITPTPEAIIVKNSIHDIKDTTYVLNARLSGTTARFILALATLVPGTKTIIGEKRLLERPIQELVDSLRQLGAHITYDDKEGFLPITIHSSTLTGHSVSMRGDISSQYFSALLMIAPLLAGLTIHVEGEQISKPYIDMTIDSMKHFGVHAENHHYQTYIVKPDQTYSSSEYTVEGDFSSAGYFFAIAALTGSTITIANLNPLSQQADKRFLEILEKMGNQISYGKNTVTIHGSGVQHARVNMSSCPDQIQTLAVLAAFVPGKTHITGVKSLRVKETERVRALEQELKKMGVRTSSTNDTLTIIGGNPHAATIHTYNDHRMAMSYAVAGAKINGMIIENPSVVDKTFPDFWKKLTDIGISLEIKESI